MKGYNHVTLVGNLVKDPIKEKIDGIEITKFTLSVGREFAIGEEQKFDHITIISFGKLAKICSDYLLKDKRVLVDGRIRVINVNTEKKKWETQIVADEVTILSKGGFIKK